MTEVLDALDLNTVKRLTDTQRRSLQLVTVRPEPPRGVRYSGGTAVWEAPHEMRNVTHYNIYVNDELTIERRVAKGQLRATAVYGDRVFVSSYNETSQLESRKVMGIGSVLGGGPGEEYTGDNHVQNFTVTIVDSESGQPYKSESGAQLFRVTGTLDLPEETGNYGGAQIVAKIEIKDGASWIMQPGEVLIADLGPEDTAFLSPPFPIPFTDQRWTFYAPERDAAGNRNSVVDGVTPKSGPFEIKKSATGTLDFGRAASSSYDTIELEVVGGQFRVKQVNLVKAFNFNTAEFEISGGAYKVKELAADKIRTGILSIGNPAGGMVSKMAGFNTSGTPYFWAGDDTANSGFQGGWFWEFRIGGTSPSTARIIADNQGNLTIKGAKFTVGPGTAGDSGQIFMFNQAAITGFMGTGDIAASVVVTTTSGGTATTAANHLLAPGDLVRIAGNSNRDHNSVFIVNTTPTSTTYTVTSGLLATGSGGTSTKQLAGAWFKECRIGGADPLTANIVANGTSVELFDTPVTITGSGAKVELRVQSGGYSDLAGLVVSKEAVDDHPKVEVQYGGIYVLSHKMVPGPFDSWLPAVHVWCDNSTWEGRVDVLARGPGGLPFVGVRSMVSGTDGIVQVGDNNSTKVTIHGTGYVDALTGYKVNGTAGITATRSFINSLNTFNLAYKDHAGNNLNLNVVISGNSVSNGFLGGILTS